MKTKLSQIDPRDVDGLTLLDIEADTREMDLEEYETKLGWEFESLAEFINESETLEDLKEERKEAQRK